MTRGPRWTVAEDAQLRRWYTQGLTVRAMSERMPRTARALRERARTLGLRRRAYQPRRRWTPAEDARLAACRRTDRALGQLAAALGRTREALVARAAYVELPRLWPRRAWRTTEDAELVRRWRGQETDAVIAAALGRTVPAVRRRRGTLQLVSASDQRRARWTAADDAALRQAWDAAIGVKHIAKRLSRTVQSLYDRARRLHLPRHAQAPRRARPSDG